MNCMVSRMAKMKASKIVEVSTFSKILDQEKRTKLLR